ncbi:unnamed protein product, partial [marine sediment metagenome]
GKCSDCSILYQTEVEQGVDEINKGKTLKV